MSPNLRENWLQILAVLAPRGVEHNKDIGVLLKADVKVSLFQNMNMILFIP